MPDNTTSSNPIIPPDLADIRLSDDGGAINLTGLKYQYHFAVHKSLEMLNKPENNIEYVSTELQDDVTVKLKNGTYEFYQVKERRGEFWRIKTLETEGVWQRFLLQKDTFGENNKFCFVSDQYAQHIVSRTPDLGKMRDITFRGEKFCTETDLIAANELIKKISQIIGVDDTQVQTIFWNTRIMTAFERRQGLFAINLNLLEELLLKKGIESDLPSRTRIYQRIISLLEESVLPDLSDLTYQEKINRRKISPEQLISCLTGPYKTEHPVNFRFDEGEHQPRSLRKKSEDGKFSEDIIRYFLDSRINFQCHYRRDVIHAADYLSQLRLKVWDVCTNGKISANLEKPNYPPSKTYQTICQELKLLAVEEEKANPPIKVDYQYLHGIMCQLTAECDNEWLLVE